VLLYILCVGLVIITGFVVVTGVGVVVVVVVVVVTGVGVVVDGLGENKDIELFDKKLSVLFVLFCLIKVLFICEKEFEVVELERNFVEFEEFEEFEMFLITFFIVSIELELSGKASIEPSGASMHIYKPVEYIGILLTLLLIPHTLLQFRKFVSPDITIPLNKKTTHHIIIFGYTITIMLRNILK